MGPASRIVRIGAATWPALVGLTVLATVTLAVPHDAWAPFANGPAQPASWEQRSGWTLEWLARTQIAVGHLIWQRDPVTGGIAVAALAGALAAAVLARSLRSAGLSPALAGLLALVAAAAPFSSWQASSPLGATPLTLVSVLLLSWFTRNGRSVLGLSRRTIVILIIAAIAAMGLADRLGAQGATSMRSLVAGDLGWPGSLLLPLPFVLPAARACVPMAVLQALMLGLLVVSPLSSDARAAVVLPWAWWLAGAGLSALLTWRPPHARRWAIVGLGCWLALHAAQRPWGLQRQQAALARSWAEGIVPLISASQPLTRDTTAYGHLVRALSVARGQNATALVAEGDVRVSADAGAHPLLLGADARERARLNGVALTELPPTTGIGIESLLDALPRGTIVLAAISRDTASRLTPSQWQALGRVGLRLTDASAPRAHALVGVTRARVEAMELAQPDSVRLVVAPGAPIGRTGTRSPVDARIEADATHVRVFLRDRPFVITRGLALVFFSTRGDLLGWRLGPSPAHVDGAPLGPDPATSAMALGALPCVDVVPGSTTDVTEALGDAAAGVTTGGEGLVDIVFRRPPGFGAVPTLLDEPDASGANGPIVTLGPTRVHVEARGVQQAGIHLRGPVQSATATSSVAARVCAAWPALPALDLAPGRALEMPMTPALDAYLGGGWHGAETLAGDRHFRWMAGGQATVLLPLRQTTPLRFALDAQGVAAPDHGDVVRLRVNGRDAGTRPLLVTRGVYTWDLAPDVLRPGLNMVTIETSQAMRPSDRHAGADGRLLGLAVYGWTLTPAPGDGQP